MKTIQMTIDDELLTQMDDAIHSLGIARSAFIRHAITLALRELAIKELEQKHAAGYQRYPVTTEEFDVWNSEQAWGEP